MEKIYIFLFFYFLNVAVVVVGVVCLKEITVMLIRVENDCMVNELKWVSFFSILDEIKMKNLLLRGQGRADGLFIVVVAACFDCVLGKTRTFCPFTSPVVYCSI